MLPTFHGDISITLEMIAKNVFDFSDTEIVETIFYTQNIEKNTFAEAMYYIINKMSDHYPNNRDTIEEFLNYCKAYLGQDTSTIQDEVILSLFNRFNEIHFELMKAL